MEQKDGDSIDHSYISIADLTSPSQLQELTFAENDNTLSSTMGLRSPGGPMRGRSVKEFDEQMSNLKKENFNLKLRIYFLEEKIGTHFTLDNDNILKKNIDLQIEVASLQKEVKDKHELLCQAVRAIELEEEEHKKYSQNKEVQIAQLQQDLEDLRIQIHSHVKSATDQDHIQVIFDHNQQLEGKISQLQQENHSKDQQINLINRELESANERLVEYAKQVKEYEEKMCQSHQVKQSLLQQLQENKKQMEELKQKYVTTKYELENDMEKLKKEVDKTKMMKDMRISMLENDNEKHKLRIRDLQTKLEHAVAEAKKNQNLAVLPPKTVADPATSHRAEETGALQLPLDIRTPESNKMSSPSNKSLSITVPPTPDGRSLSSFEQVILHNTGDMEKLVSEFQKVKDDVNAYQKKIVKLKSEQLKACEIIKSMLETRNKSNEDIENLKKDKQKIEKERVALKQENQRLLCELESVVSKPESEVGLPANRRLAELNLRRPQEEAGTPPCEMQEKGDGMDVAEQYKALIDELETKIEVLMATLHEKDTQLETIKDQYDEILSMFQEKQDRIVELEFELLCSQDTSVKSKLGSCSEKADCSISEKQTSFYKHEIEEKDKDIKRLNAELRKCTCHLQSLVNKELWDKNRQIEKMETKKQEHTPELLKLRKSLSTKEMQLEALKEKISELGLNLTLPSDFDENMKTSTKRNIEHIRMLQDSLKAAKEERDYFENKVSELEKKNKLVDQLESEKKHLENQLEYSEKVRFELNEICTALGTRLQELAIFLDSLLQQKSVLGFLGAPKNKKLREIISQSLDMSRSLSMSLMGNSEQSLAQLSNITALLNGSVLQDLSLACDEPGVDEGSTNLSIIQSNITLTYESPLSFKKVNSKSPNQLNLQPKQEEQEIVITALREQVFNLKSELQVRDNELNRLQQENLQPVESGVEKLTDTDSAEETKNMDSSKVFTENKLRTSRSHTLALTPKSNTSTITVRMKGKSDVQSESEAWSEPDRAVSRARIGLQDPLAPSTPRSSRIVCYESTEDDETGIGMTLTPGKIRLSANEMHQEIIRLENELDQKIEDNCAEKQLYLEKLQEMEQDIKSMKQKLVLAQNERDQAKDQLQQLHKTVEELSALKAKYQMDSENQNKELLNRINEIEVGKNELLKKCQYFEKQALNAQNELTCAEGKLTHMQEEINNLEKEHRKELQNAEEVFTTKINQLEKIYEQQLKQAKECVNAMQEECKRDHVQKCEVEKKLQQFEYLTTELNNLKSTVQSYEETINNYKKKHNEMNDVIQDYEEKTNALRKDLDSTTLQYSEAVLEKTKLCNEKAFLEQELSKVNSKQVELETKLSETVLAQSEQILLIQTQKSELELKLSDLESKNAELKNRLVKLQVDKCNFNRSLPRIGGTSLFVTNQPHYGDRTNYSSAEEIGEELQGCFGDAISPNNANGNIRSARVDAERTVANSSPDLGIESDHGRFSSLEAQSTMPGNNKSGVQVGRPLQETIQITECMNNLLDNQNDQSDNSAHCCQKSQDIIQENNELKRKLLRMKRALEDTTTQLTLANQRKKQVEKTICKQIHKTSQVLRKAKANLDSGSEI